MPGGPELKVRPVTVDTEAGDGAMSVVRRTDMSGAGGTARRLIALAGIGVIGGLGSAAPAPIAADHLELP